MKYLMIFAIGPVQDFIATARRSRDLWYGSWMLSELSRAVALRVLEHSGELIFPADPRNMTSIPNKIMAIVSGDPRTLADAAKESLIVRMQELADEALDAIRSQNYNRSLAEKQIGDLPEFYWVCVPYDEGNYAGARAEAEALLAARKATRNFHQVEGSSIPKSSLDGARESVINETAYPARSDPNRDQMIRNLYHTYHARPGERLSGVDLLKRMGGAKSVRPFLSTSHMAALPFMEALGDAKCRQLVTHIRQLFDEAGWDVYERDDGALLYESRLADWVPAGIAQNNLKKALNKALDDFAGKSRRPGAYYALLAADGDNMGLVIDAQKNENAHRELSQFLSKFAEEVPRILDAHQGLLIYSGGDDVLAYLPLNTVLECARHLEESFRTMLKQFTAVKEEEVLSPTLSVGIVIAHHLDPLSDVLELARLAERTAKEVDGKNGLAITLSKRSGVDRTIHGEWDLLYNRLKTLIEFSRTGAISAGTAYELNELHRILFESVPPAGLAAEAMRIIGRKQQSGGTGVVSDEVKKSFERWILKDDVPLDQLAHEMIVARSLMGDPIPAMREEVTP